MKFCLVTVLLITSQTSSYARTAHHTSRAGSDPAYSSALAAANRFLHAWQNEDHESGIVMLAWPTLLAVSTWSDPAEA